MGCIYSDIPPSNASSKSSKLSCHVFDEEEHFFYLPQLEQISSKLEELVMRSSVVWKENEEYLVYTKGELEAISRKIEGELGEGVGKSTLESFIGRNPSSLVHEGEGKDTKNKLVVHIVKGSIVDPNIHFQNCNVEILVQISESTDSVIRQTTKPLSGSIELQWNQYFHIQFKPRENWERLAFFSLQVHTAFKKGKEKGNIEYPNISFSFSEFFDQKIHSKAIELKDEDSNVILILKFQLIHNKKKLLESWLSETFKLSELLNELLKKISSGKHLENFFDEEFSMMSRRSLNIQNN